MSERSGRQLDYRALSTWVQRVILGIAPPKGAANNQRKNVSSADEAARRARNLELSARGPAEARALRELGACLVELGDAKSESAQQDSRAAVLCAAESLGSTCPDFANPPLNGIWADANIADVTKIKADT